MAGLTPSIRNILSISLSLYIICLTALSSRKIRSLTISISISIMSHRVVQ